MVHHPAPTAGIRTTHTAPLEMAVTYNRLLLLWRYAPRDVSLALDSCQRILYDMHTCISQGNWGITSAAINLHCMETQVGEGAMTASPIGRSLHTAADGDTSVPPSLTSCTCMHEIRCAMASLYALCACVYLARGSSAEAKQCVCEG